MSRGPVLGVECMRGLMPLTHSTLPSDLGSPALLPPTHPCVRGLTQKGTPPVILQQLAARACLTLVTLPP